MEITGGAVTYNILQVPIDISNTLTYCASNNSATQGLINKPYMATITAHEGYTLEGATVSVIMNNVDVTNSVYSNGVINIRKITGDISISIEAIEEQKPWEDVYFRITSPDTIVYTYKYGSEVSINISKTQHLGEITGITYSAGSNIYEPNKTTEVIITEDGDKFILYIPHIYSDVYYSYNIKQYDLTTTVTVTTTSNSYNNRDLKVEIVENPTSSQLLMKNDGSVINYAYTLGSNTFKYSLQSYHTHQLDFISDRYNLFYFNTTPAGSSSTQYLLGSKTINALITNIKLGDNFGPILVNSVFRSAKITEISIPEKVTEIQNYALSQCSKLAKVVIKSLTVPTLGSNVFYQDTKLENIYVLDNLVSTYKTSTNWSEYADIIKPISQMPTT